MAAEVQEVASLLPGSARGVPSHNPSFFMLAKQRGSDAEQESLSRASAFWKAEPERTAEP